MAQNGFLVLFIVKCIGILLGIMVGLFFGQREGFNRGHKHAMDVVDFTLKRAHTEGGLTPYFENTADSLNYPIQPEVLMSHGVNDTSKLPKNIRDRYLSEKDKDITLDELLARRG